MSMMDWFTLTASLTSLCLLCFIIGVVAGERDDPHQPKPKNGKNNWIPQEGPPGMKDIAPAKDLGKDPDTAKVMKKAGTRLKTLRRIIKNLNLCGRNFTRNEARIVDHSLLVEAYR